MLGVGDGTRWSPHASAMVDRPEFVADLVDRTTDFYCVCLEKVLSKVPVTMPPFMSRLPRTPAP